MEKYKRIFVIVLDSLGIGAMPDSEKFGDVGVDTFGHILERMGTLGYSESAEAGNGKSPSGREDGNGRETNGTLHACQ